MVWSLYQEASIGESLPYQVRYCRVHECVVEAGVCPGRPDGLSPAGIEELLAQKAFQGPR